MMLVINRLTLLLFTYILPAMAIPVCSQTVVGKSNLVHIKVTEQPAAAGPMLSYGGVVFKDQNKNQAIDPQEEASINFTLKNEGKGTSQNLLVKAYTSNEIRGLTFPKEMKIDSLAPGKSREISIPINSSKSLESGTANIIIEIKEEFEFDPDQIEINILTEEVKK
jgi:uncharacterized membrane protein